MKLRCASQSAGVSRKEKAGGTEGQKTNGIVCDSRAFEVK